MRKRVIVTLILFALFKAAQAQKGEKSIAAGLLVSFPKQEYFYDNHWKTGVGVEAIGQYNITNKSALLAQLQLTRFAGFTYECYRWDNYTCVSFTYRPLVYTGISLKGGYRYQFTHSGFYANVLGGVEMGNLRYYSPDDFLYTPAALGLGKRFTIKDVYFLDAGIDYMGGYIRRFNLKAVFSLYKNSKED